MLNANASQHTIINEASSNISNGESSNTSSSNSSFDMLSNGSTGHKSGDNNRSSPTTPSPVARPRTLQPPAYTQNDLSINTPDDSIDNCSDNDDTNKYTGPLLESDKKTNRFWQKVKYLMKKKKIIMPFTALITMLSVSHMTKPFFELIEMHNRMNAFNILGGVVLASLALFVCWTLIQSFRMEEHKITNREHNKVLEEILEKLPKDKLIKYVMVDRSNGIRSYFELQTLMNQTSKSFSISGGKIVKGHFMSDWLCAISNRRMVVPILFTTLVFGNITFFLTHAMFSELSFSQIFNPTNLQTVMIPTLLAFGLMTACIIYNISHTKFEKILHIHNEEKCNPAEANEEVIQHIKNKLKEENKSRMDKEPIKGPSSKTTRVTVEFLDYAEHIFNVN